MKLLSAREMKDIDKRATSEYGIPSLLLMENAGIRTVEIIEKMLERTQGKKVLIISGKGNNGGDGLVIARHLMNAGAYVDTFLLTREDEMTVDSHTNYNILSKMKGNILPLYGEKDLDKLMLSLLSCDLIVDALYGIGFKGTLSDFDSRIVKMINWSKKPVAAVDIPSGVEADTGRVNGEAVKATHTISFALPKIGLILRPGKDYVGSLSVADISIPRSLLKDDSLKNNLINESMVKTFINKRDPESHKGTYGHTLIVGGSAGMSGAVIMTAAAALRCGAGLVTAAVPESLLPIVESCLTEVISAPLAQNIAGTIAMEALPQIESLLGKASVCALGPGMSGYSDALALIHFILQKSGVPVVIDADGLNALQGNLDILKNRQVPLILTPHPGEMARLTGQSINEIQNNRLEIARGFAQSWGVTLVLKGNNTVIASSTGEIYININGNPGMATAGSGDVLCGIISSLISQGLKPLPAALAGVFLHGLAGDQAAAIKGQRGLIAGDIIDYLPDILKAFEI
ncbi:MAG: NAD(P)H-hydrate dehydratase [Syntrophomonadaceae bacterium]|nr:NAD(P)H-hydrate dehydratase [Syntrophomonadaceae bacterium]MDD3022625.1 NAD(P)H-hydrate dehydratase [Syntrophomonadaceae bacterium]